MKPEMLGFTSTVTIVTALLWAPPATAQAQEAPAPQADQTGVADIIVTAQRREEKLQSVPIAATALTSDELNQKAVTRLGDLQYAAPSLSITDQGLTQSVNIRGIGISSGSPQVANGVATYIDGVFQPPIVTSSSFYDIGSVEVLRGPQGTLVGSNSTGGAIFINTQNPSTDKMKGYAQASYGSYNAVSAEGAVNLPISSTLAVRFAGVTRWRDSYYHDVGSFHNKPDSLDEQAGRIGIMWNPANFRAVAKVEWVDKNTGGYAYRPILTTAFAADRLPDFRELDYNAPTLNHERAFNSSLELRYELDGGIVLRSVSGYTNKRINNLYDTDGGSLLGAHGESPNQTQDQFVREREYTEEINIISPTTGAFNWILGGYAQKNKIDVIIKSLAGAVTDPTDIRNFQDKLTLGAFAQAGYKITPALEVQLGVRYSNYKVTSSGNVVIGAGGPIFGPTGLQVADLAASHNDGRLTGKLGLNWNLGGEGLIYVFAARGYKPGGANSVSSEFGPETVWDYEAGWKSSFFRNHLRTQLGIFYMDYHDFQFDTVEPSTGQSGVVNISNATIKGAEFQAQAKFGGLSFDGGIAYVDSKLAAVTIVNSRALPSIPQYGPQCPAGTPSNPPVCFNYTPFLVTAGGGPNLFSPKWSYNAGVQYEAGLGDGVSLTPRLNYAFVGPRWTNLLYVRATDYLRARGLLSAQLTLKVHDWTIEGYATNLADKVYVSGQSGNNEFYGAPREFGVRVATRF
ncbi:TonB-dependent receptor [Sphingomonas oligophenolica]|uniref:TonB-dependent receptor n=1 Tax=Sphingomonas oligophenolica TaxID=301154 RepID=A0ABU9Y8A2_9SPHN